MTFYVQAPIFVFREFMRHRIASYNEESRSLPRAAPRLLRPGARSATSSRWASPAPTTFVPGTRRAARLVDAEIREAAPQAYESYQRMLDAGIAREVARIVLPRHHLLVDVRDDERALAHELPLACAPSARARHFPSFPQREIEMVAEKMEDFWAEPHAAHLRGVQRERSRLAVGSGDS